MTTALSAPRALTPSLETQAQRWAAAIQTRLAELGIRPESGFRLDAAGDAANIGLHRLLITDDDQCVIVVLDTRTLPTTVRPTDLEDPRLLAALSEATGADVRALRGRAIGRDFPFGYLVQPRTVMPARLPDRAELGDPPVTLDYPVPFGVDADGQAVWRDLMGLGHLLLGGQPGGGKSTLINAILVSLLRRHGPATLQLTLVDPKAVELSFYRELPHLARPVATDAEQAVDVVDFLVAEMTRREQLLVAARVKDLARYNAQAAEPLPVLLAVFDEVTDLVLTWGGSETEPFRQLTRVASKGRALGIHLLLATQNPKAKILDTAIRELCSLRVAFKVDTALHSKSILGRSGAEQIPPGKPGRMWVGGLSAELAALQGFVVDDDAVSEVVRRWRTGVATPLTEIEARLVLLAAEKLGGDFTINRLFLMSDRLLPQNKLTKLAKLWEARGWLSEPASATSPRRVTPALLELARRSLLNDAA